MTKSHHQRRAYHRTYTPRPPGVFSLKEFVVDSKEDTKRYPLDRENFSVLQGLVFKQAGLFRRTLGIGKSRAQIMAEDDIAERCVIGLCSGTDLAAWLGSQRNGYRQVYHPDQPNAPVQISDPVLETSVPVSTPLRDTDTFNNKLTGRTKIVDPVLAQLIEKCRPIKPKEVWSFPTQSEDEARSLAEYMPKVSAALGWRNGKKAHTYLYQIFPDRLKIKRLI